MNRDEVASLRFVVLGAARSGIAAALLLRKHGADVVVADSKPAEAAVDIRKELDSLGIPSGWGDAESRAALVGRQVLVKSPGIPQTNPLVVAARDSGIRIISEIELASAFVPDGTRVIAITGTNGKTTTTAWLAHVLDAAGFNAIPAGNIGDAWCRQLSDIEVTDAGRTVYVVEVSSFQLEDLEDFHPDVAVLTNLAPDHMDRYNDQMDLYVAAKANILLNLDQGDVFIWNQSNAESRPLAERSPAVSCGFSADTHSGDLSAWVEDGQLRVKIADEAIPVLPVSELPLPGHHNIENALCVLLAAVAVGAKPDVIAAGLKSFPGVEHRIELCGTREDGVRFYNDSKATNLDAMEKAVQAFTQPIVLIAGGRDAHSDYSSIAHLIKQHVVNLVALGEAAQLIEDAWGKLVPTSRASTMAEAVSMANNLAKPGDVVVFSPACKSFDMYNNYEERGRDFKREVKLLLGRP